MALAEGKELDFFAATLTEIGFFLNTCGLPTPTVDAFEHPPHFEEALTALRLSCDIVRFALKLWTSGIRACLHMPWPCGEDTTLLSKIEGVRCHQGEDRATFWVGLQDPPLQLFHRV